MKLRTTVFGLLILIVVQPAMAAKDSPGASSSLGKASQVKDASSGSKMALSQGLDRLLDEIYKRRKELTEGERELARREVAVGELEALIEERIAILEKNRQEIEERITAWEGKDGDRAKKLSKVYAAMPAAKAARLLEKLDLDLAVAVLSGMKQKDSAQILALIPSTRALTMSKRMLRPLGAPPAGRAK